MYKPIHVWHYRTLCLRLIWLIFAEGRFLWVAWHKHHHLRISSFWALSEHKQDSWHWKSLLDLRPLARPFITCKIQDGLSASFWFDSWTPLGPLVNAIGNSGTRMLRLPSNAVVADSCRNSQWNLPPPRSDVVVDLHAFLTTIPVPTEEAGADYYSWTVDGEDFSVFPSSKTWSILRESQPQQAWYSAIWFKGHIPKHAFTMWVAVQDRLPTRCRLSSWGILTPLTCCLCLAADETRDHLFIDCSFTKDIWKMMLLRLSESRQGFDSWNHLLAWYTSVSSKSIRALRGIAVQTIIYSLWIERNNRAFNNQVNTTSDLFKQVDRTIRNIISARKTRKAFKHLMALWLV